MKLIFGTSIRRDCRLMIARIIDFFKHINSSQLYVLSSISTTTHGLNPKEVT
jgi:hypothetical protein